MPLFSVIVPTFNRAGLLADALDSLAAQTNRDFEAIVADDGSADDTAAVAGRYPFVRYVRQANAGPGAARNLGLRHAAGRYVAFLDSDDLWFPWTLATYATVLTRHGDPAVLIGRAHEFADPAGLSAARHEPLASDPFADPFATTCRTCWYGTPALVARRDTVQTAGGFTDERVNAEDLDLFMRLGTAPGCAIIDAPVTFAYRRHAGSAVGSVSRTLAGLRRLVANERARRYPGGLARRRERLELLTRFVRPSVLAAARAGHLRAAWELYRLTLGWHLRLRRCRFVFGAPVAVLASVARGGRAR